MPPQIEGCRGCKTEFPQVAHQEALAIIALQHFPRENGEEALHHFWALENDKSLVKVTETLLQMGQKVRGPIEDALRPLS